MYAQLHVCRDTVAESACDVVRKRGENVSKEKLEVWWENSDRRAGVTA